MIEILKASLVDRPGKSISKTDNSIESLPRAAVCIILKPGPKADDLLILFVKRLIRDGDPWSGHMAFAGGRYSDKDSTLLETALRESYEETGIQLPHSSILGSLDEILPGNSMIRVTPYVALLNEDADVQMQKTEIEDFVWIPLSFFMDQKNLFSYEFTRKQISVRVPAYNFMEKGVIWGMTLRILQDLISRVGGKT